MNKHIITTYACLIICIYFGYQAPRAATGGGTALLYAISCGFLIVCMICAVKYEAAQLFKNKVPRSTKFKPFNSNDPATHPKQDGVYAIRYIDNGQIATAVSYWTEGAFLKLKRIQVDGWAGPYQSPEDVCQP
jgi:hypothetical protein